MPSDLTDLHMLVLSWFDSEGVTPLEEVALVLGLEREDVERLCAELEAAGLIEQVAEQ